MPFKRKEDEVTANENVPTKIVKEIIDLCQRIYDELRNYKSDDGRTLSENFLRLASKKANASKQVIDLTIIQNKIKNEEYKKFEEFDDDITLMVTNANTYRKTSQEYRDASELWDFYHEKKKLVAESFTTQRKVDDIALSNRSTTRKRTSAINRKNSVDSVEAEIKVEPTTSKKRLKRKLKGKNAAVEEEAGSESDNTESKSVAESVEETVNFKKKRSVESNENLADYLEDYFDVIASSQDGGRYIANIFHLLPSYKDYPDYYEITKDPIDLKTIGQNVLNQKYKSLEAMEQDLLLMVSNAKRYNDPKSVLYKDAQILRRIITNTRSDIENAMKNEKSFGVKTREKKHSIVLEIAQLEGDGKSNNNEINTNLNDQDEEDEDDEDDDEEEEEEEEDEEDEEDEDSVVVEETNEGGGGDDVLWSLFTYIKDYRHSNQILIDPFNKLPNKRFYPDYYEEIKKPIALNHVKTNLKKGKYSTLKELFKDIELIFKNAMSYNREDSTIYVNAKRLHNALTSKFNELDQQKSPKNEQQKPTIKPQPSKRGATNSENTPVQSFFNETVPVVTMPNPNYAQLDLKEKLLIIFNYINDYKEQGTKRELADPFKHLPSKLEYPDYYNVIKKPMDLTKIYNKIISSHYSTCEDLISDYAQCFENACIYNEPGSQIYKDALQLQKLSFYKRIEVDTSLNDDAYTVCDVNGAIQDILTNIYDATFNYQDNEGRKLSDSFLELFNSNLNLASIGSGENLLTFQRIKQNLLLQLYKRLDAFQDDVFRMFDQVRRIFNRKSQIYKDSIDLQNVFINRRDEVCKKGEIINSNAFAYKTASLEEDEMYVADSNQNEENMLNEILQPNYLTKLKESLAIEFEHQKQSITFPSGDFRINVNDFIYLNKFSNGFNQDHIKIESDNIVACVLSIGCGESVEPLIDSKKYKLLVQLYLKPTDICGHKHKFIQNEVFKSDIYEIIELDQIKKQKCHVISLKDYTSYSVESPDLFICESIYSTREKLFRKVKKWQTNFSTASNPTALVRINSLSYDLEKLKFTPRSSPPVIHRGFLNSNEINDIKSYSNDNTVIECKKINILLSQSQTSAIQENENYLYYEQIFYKNQCYKMGDFFYIKQRLNERNELVPATLTQLPIEFDEMNKGVILRVDRLWRVRAQNDTIQQNKLVDNNDYATSDTTFFIKGPIFLRAIDIHHEPTRLFNKNEVFKDSVREFTTVLGEIRGRCVVLNVKKYTSSRPTEINEADVYICDTKYVADQRTCRKFTKGLKQFELSHKCYEDEVYFFKKELRLRKFLSPILLNEKLLIFTINNNASNLNAKSGENYQMEEETNSNSLFSNDYNGMGDMHMDVSNCSSNMGTPVKTSKMTQLNNLLNASAIDKEKSGNYRINKNGKLVRKRVKRSKKCGYNIFSKEFRKKLRDAHSSLSFIEMSREVGNHWRLLTDRERQEYEERAKEESIKEAAKMAEMDGKTKIPPQKQNQQAQQPQQQQQQQSTHNIPSNGQHINQIFASQNTSIKPIQPNNQTILNNPQYNVINFAPSNAVQLNLNYGQNTAYIIKQPNQAIQVDPNGTLQLNEFIQRADQPQNKGPFVNYQTKPSKPQHSEAYMKYIERIKRSQDASSRFQASSNSDWQSYLDIRPSHMRESNMTAAPTNWIENLASGDVYKHLVSLRYHLLNDTVNIKRYEVVNGEEEEVDEIIDLESNKMITESSK